MQPPTIKQMTDDQLIEYLESLEPFASQENPICQQAFNEAYQEGVDRQLFVDFERVHAFERVFEPIDIVFVGNWQGLQS